MLFRAKLLCACLQRSARLNAKMRCPESCSRLYKCQITASSELKSTKGEKKMRFSIALILSSLLSAGSCLLLLHERNQRFPNRITLRCFDVNGRLSNALYFLNGTNLEQRTTLVRRTESATFSITSNLEGNFTCSSNSDRGVQSAPVQLICKWP